MNQEQIKEMEELIEEVMWSPIKNDMKIPLSKLRSLQGAANLESYQAEKLWEAIHFAEEAAGQVANKERRVDRACGAWSEFTGSLSK